LAHHVYEDDAGSFDPGRVEPGDIVFVTTRLARGSSARFHCRIELGQGPWQIVYAPRRYYRNHDRATPDLYPAAWRLP
jgi:hypothetical protein